MSRVLITNDDGVEAPGLHALAVAMHGAGHEVVVVAPSGERSGAGASIGRLHRGGPITWTEVTWSDLPGVPVHSVDVPPAAAVYAAGLGAFGPPPDIVASGVNPGLNYGHLVLHSGTVGAALTARVLGISGVAVSIGWDEHPAWPTAAMLAARAVPWLAAQPVTTTVNINAPNLAPDALAGVRAAALTPFLEQWTAVTSPGELLLTYDGHTAEPADDTDLALTRAGFAAVTLLGGIGEPPTGDVAAAVAAIGAT